MGLWIPQQISSMKSQIKRRSKVTLFIQKFHIYVFDHWLSTFQLLQLFKFKLQTFIFLGFTKNIKDMSNSTFFLKNFQVHYQNKIQVYMRGLRNIHTKICTSALLKKWDLIKFVDFCVVDKRHILKFLNSPPFACI